MKGKKPNHSWERTGDTITCSLCSTTYTIGVSEINYEPDTPNATYVLTGANFFILYEKTLKN